MFGEDREYARLDFGDKRVLTVLKYSIAFIIFPFSSGTNNIPKASLALSSALLSISGFFMGIEDEVR